MLILSEVMYILKEIEQEDCIYLTEFENLLLDKSQQYYKQLSHDFINNKSIPVRKRADNDSTIIFEK